MTRIVTPRVTEVISSNIVGIKEAAAKLNESCELQELEEDLVEVEKAVAELRSTLAGLPYQHPSPKE